MTSLDSIEIRPSALLVGRKYAYGDDKLLLVSPAIYDLITHANEDELRQLVEKIEVKKYPITKALSLYREASP